MRGDSRGTLGHWAGCARRAAASHTLRGRCCGDAATFDWSMYKLKLHWAGMIGVSIKAGYIELNREPPWLEPVRDGVSRQKVGRGRRQQFVQSCRTRSQPGQPRRRPGAGQRAGLRAPPLRSGRRRRSSRLERPKIGPHSLVEAQHPVRAGAKRVGRGRGPHKGFSVGLAKTPHFTCVGPTYLAKEKPQKRGRGEARAERQRTLSTHRAPSLICRKDGEGARPRAGVARMQSFLPRSVALRPNVVRTPSAEFFDTRTDPHDDTPPRTHAARNRVKPHRAGAHSHTRDRLCCGPPDTAALASGFTRAPLGALTHPPAGRAPS